MIFDTKVNSVADLVYPMHAPSYPHRSLIAFAVEGRLHLFGAWDRK